MSPLAASSVCQSGFLLNGSSVQPVPITRRNHLRRRGRFCEPPSALVCCDTGLFFGFAMSTPAATITISGLISGLPAGSETIGPLTIANANSGAQVTQLTSVNGNNALTVPGTNFVGAIIVPPAGSTLAKFLKGVNGDTGVNLHPANPTLISLPTSSANFVLNVAGIETISIVWF